MSVEAKLYCCIGQMLNKLLSTFSYIPTTVKRLLEAYLRDDQYMPAWFRIGYSIETLHITWSKRFISQLLQDEEGKRINRTKCSRIFASPTLCFGDILYFFRPSRYPPFHQKLVIATPLKLLYKIY